MLLEQEAAVFGLQWETSDQIMTQIRNECLEIEEHLHFPEQREALQDEIGDLLHAAFSLCVFNNFSPEVTLRKSLDKFEHRLNAMKKLAVKRQLSFPVRDNYDCRFPNIKLAALTS